MGQSTNEKIRFMMRVQQDIFATPCVSYNYVIIRGLILCL